MNRFQSSLLTKIGVTLGFLLTNMTVTAVICSARAQPAIMDAGQLDPATIAKFQKKPSYSPYANRTYPTRVFWGDEHLHTAWSADAGMTQLHSTSPILRGGAALVIAFTTAGVPHRGRPRKPWAARRPPRIGLRFAANPCILHWRRAREHSAGRSGREAPAWKNDASACASVRPSRRSDTQ